MLYLNQFNMAAIQKNTFNVDYVPGKVCLKFDSKPYI